MTMKTMNSKLLNTLLILMTVAVVASGYYAFVSYNSFEEVKRTTKPSEIVSKVSQMLDALDLERVNSAAYLAKREQGDLDKVINVRKQVDELLQQLETTVNTNNTYNIYNKQVGIVGTTLETVRKK